MSVIVNILTNPATYSPANAEIWFQFNSASYSISNFKYVMEVFELDGNSNAVQSLGVYKIPPRPVSGDGLFTPNKIIKSLLSYTLDPDWGIGYQISGTYGYQQSIATESNCIKQYSLNYGYQYDPGLTFSDTIISGTSVGFTFSTPHGLVTGDIVNINKTNKNINSYYDGQSTIIRVPNTYAFVIDKVIGTISIVETGSVTDVLRIQNQTDDFWAYNGTRQYLEISENFGATYVVSTGASYSFLENYQGYKQIFNSQYETSQFFADQTAYYILSPFMWALFINAGTSSASIWTSNGIYTTNSNVYYNSGLYHNLVGSYSTINPATDTSNWQFDVNISLWNPSYAYSSNDIVYYDGKLYENHFPGNTYSIINDSWTIGGIRVKTYDSNVSLLNTYTFSAGFTSSYSKSYYIPTGTKNLEYLGVTFSSTYRYDIELYGGTSSITKASLNREIICNPSPFTNVRIAYLNRLGSFEYLNFNYDSKRTAAISRTEYKQVLPWNYTVGMRGSNVLSQKVEESYQLATNWLTQYDYWHYNELLTSPEVYIIATNGQYYPIIVTDSTYEYKTSLRDKLFNLVITVRNAYQINLQNQ